MSESREAMNTIQEQAKDASLNRLWMHTVGIVNGIRTVGYDPTTQRRGDGEEPGTGSAGLWGTHQFILTAKHVVEKAQPGDLRIFCRPSGGIEYRRTADLRKQDIVDAVPINEQNAVIHRCKWEDLALVTTTPKAAGGNVEFFDVANEWIDPPEGEILHCFGFPLDTGLIVEKKMIGNKEERTVALPPSVFPATVLPQPTEDELKFKITSFDSRKHYLVSYDAAAQGRHPRGISGAAMWWQSDKKQIVWRPNFKFAGVCTVCYKGGAVEQVVKASLVRRFLKEVFGASRTYSSRPCARAKAPST